MRYQATFTAALATFGFAKVKAQHNFTQYTPGQADWSTFYSKVAQTPSVVDHSPDGVLWLQPSAWVPWDGTIIDPDSMSTAEFTEKICPTGDTILGLREVFYEHNTFADIQNPTKAEIDEWHRLSLNHLRRLVGIVDTPMEPDQCLYARALWGQQRQYSRIWDAAYPEKTCAGSTNGHCGASFIPSPEDQVAYLPPGHPPCRKGAGSEGVFPVPKSNIPWSIKWVRVFCSTVKREGYNGGHTGPFFKRQKFGFGFWDWNPDKYQSTAILRAKWQ